MNWTGGKLQRQKKWGKSQQNKQQEHFANVRTKLNGPADHGSWLPSFIRDGTKDSKSSKRRARPSSGRQSKLGEYNNMAPVINCLRSLSPRKTDHISKTHMSGKFRNVRPLSDCDDGLNGQSREYRNVEDIVKSRRHGPNFLNETPPLLSRNEQASDDDEEAREPNTDTLNKGTVKNNDGSTLNDLAQEASPKSSNKLELQRRQLLDQSDWLGLDRSKPLHMSFASDRGKERVAKRRKLDDQDRLRKETTRLARHPVPSIHGEYMMRGALQHNPMAQDDSSIRIRIGDAALVSQTDAASRFKGATVTAKSASSDSMLLDEEFDGPLSLPRFDGNLKAELQSRGSSRESGDHDPEGQAIDDAAVHQEITEWSRGEEQILSGPLTAEDRHRAMDHVCIRNEDCGRLTKTPIAMTPADYDNHFATSSSAVLPAAASTQGAVHGSIVSATLQHTHSPLLQESVAERRTGADGAWRDFMDIYTEADFVSTTTGPTSIAFTNFRRGAQEHTGKTVQAQRKHQPTPSVWDVPDTPPKIFAIPAHRKPEFVSAKQVAESSTVSTTTLPVRPKAQPDPDAAWKAFVFGDDNGSAPSTASDVLGQRSDQQDATHQAAKKPHVSRGPFLPTMNAATFGSSSLLTSSSGVGPPSVNTTRIEGENVSSPTKSSFPYDRPSSIANASTTATVLHARSTHRKSRRSTFSPPRKHDSWQGKSRANEDEVENIEESD